MRFVTKLSIAFLSLCAFFQSDAQKKGEVNILSYYAVTNSIDGQPFIDNRNLLRFYPVFALRDSVTSVKITIYYGNEVFIDNAAKFKEGLYWEVKLPEFDLGDAIQRYEVETRIKYNVKIKDQINNYKKGIVEKNKDLDKRLSSVEENQKKFNKQCDLLSSKFDSLTDVLNFDRDQFRELKSYFQIASDPSYPSQIKNGLAKISQQLGKLESDLKNQGKDTLSKKLDTLSLRIDSLSDRQETFISNSLRKTSEAQKSDSISQQKYQGLGKSIEWIRKKVNGNAAKLFFIGREQKDIADYITSQERIIDTLKRNLVRQLTDKSFSGISIQKSDIMFEGDSAARILYRNYKDENRHLVVLDPAERLSIFKIRYVPFPVVGSTLAGPNQDGVPIVFEVGVTFGNQVVTSNDFYKPSIERLGVAVALTPQLFARDAKILALLFTYDFNTYASIGVGANFGTGVSTDNPPRKMEPYFSFGINQKAFQKLISGIANIFK